MAAAQGSWSQANKADWQRQRLQDELARGVHSATGPVAKFLAGEPMVKSPPKDAFAALNDKLNRKLERTIKSERPQPSREDIEAAAEAGATLSFDGYSECFANLSWTDGVVEAVFQTGHSYSAPLDLSTFLDWTEDSAGKYFNHVLGRDFLPRQKPRENEP